MDDSVVRDRISDLPWEILDNILGRLRINTVVKTASLSRKWRDKWIDVSKLVSDDYSERFNCKVTPCEFMNLVYNVLLSHRGTIENFTITYHGSQADLSYDDIDTWISFMQKCEIKELTFSFPSIRTLPSSLFSCQKLRRVCLTNSWLSVPENFSGFRALVSLQMTSVWPHTDEELEKMINSWTNLEKLVLKDTSFKRLTICLPSLRYLSLEGAFEDVYVKNCPHLDHASFKMTRKAEDNSILPLDCADTLYETSHNMVQPLNWLSCSRRLVMTGHFLKYLAKRCNQYGVNIDCRNLEVLKLDQVHMDDLDEMTIVFSILRSSSKLNTLFFNGIATYSEDICRFIETPNQERCCFNKLRVVRIIIVRTYDEPEGPLKYRKVRIKMEFPEIIRLLLARSPILENMHVLYLYLETNDLCFMRTLLLCERASSQLKFTYNSICESPQYPFNTRRPGTVIECYL